MSLKQCYIKGFIIVYCLLMAKIDSFSNLVRSLLLMAISMCVLYINNSFLLNTSKNKDCCSGLDMDLDQWVFHPLILI